MNVTNEQLWEKATNFIKYKLTKPLSIYVEDERAMKWRHIQA